MKFYLRNVFYLPLTIPEEIIWNQEFAENFLTVIGKAEFIAMVNGASDFKEKFLLVSEAMTSDRKNIDSAERIFLEKWLNDKPETFNQVISIISAIRDL